MSYFLRELFKFDGDGACGKTRSTKRQQRISQSMTAKCTPLAENTKLRVAAGVVCDQASAANGLDAALQAGCGAGPQDGDVALALGGVLARGEPVSPARVAVE